MVVMFDWKSEMARVHGSLPYLSHSSGHPCPHSQTHSALLSLLLLTAALHSSSLSTTLRQIIADQLDLVRVNLLDVACSEGDE